MELSKLQRFYFLLTIIMVGVLAVHLQQSFLLHWDISWLLHAASELLKGGTYSNNFFEIGPPTNLLIYTPAILISKLFSLSIIVAVRIYIFTLGLISLASCYALINKLLKDVKLGLAFLISLEVAFFILPLHDFGQKEHLFFIFVVPYILLMACRVQKIQIGTYNALWIGLFAGLGIAMKPSFLIFPLFLELYYVATYKGAHSSKWLCFIRPETCGIFCVFLIYTSITVIFFRDYLTVVSPYALRWYYASVAVPWYVLIQSDMIWFSLAVFVVSAIQYKFLPYKQLITVLAIAVLAAILSYFLQRTTFSYHLYPITAFNWLLSVLLIGWYIDYTNNTKHHFLISALVTLFFMAPFFVEATIFGMARLKKDDAFRHMIAFTDQHARHKSIYFFSTLLEHVPIVDYCRDTTTAMRFANFWMLPAMTKQNDTTINYQTDKQFLIRMITEDLHNKKPHLVFVDVSRYKPFFYSFQDKRYRQFDFLPFFLSENVFAGEWKQYHYLTTVRLDGYKNNPELNSDRKFAVYQRNN